MSKLIKKLQQITENTAPPMGFKTSVAKTQQKILLIAALADTGKVTQLAGTDIDAMLIYATDSENDLPLKEVQSNTGEMPWGLYADSITEEGVEEVKKTEGDFIIFDPAEAPATLLQEEIGKIMKVNFPCEDGLIRAIQQMPVDAILLDLMEEGESLNISQIMDCQWLAGSMDKPLLVVVDNKLGDKELRSLNEAGVKGLIVEADGDSQSELTRLREAISALPALKKKTGGKRGVMLPSLGDVEEEDD